MDRVLARIFSAVENFCARRNFWKWGPLELYEIRRIEATMLQICSGRLYSEVLSAVGDASVV